jgi:hypothetical protein
MGWEPLANGTITGGRLQPAPLRTPEPSKGRL